MLNMVEILIKIVKYFELDDSAIGQTTQKRRFIYRDLNKGIYNRKATRLIDALKAQDLNIDLGNIIVDLLDGYGYLSHVLSDAYSVKHEKRYNWLLLKYYVIPLLATQMNEYFSDQKNIKNKLLVRKFWYLPIITKTKITYPINIVLDWWIDLHGTSNYKFYHAQTTDENILNKNREHTLKDWHDNFVIPKLDTIKEYTAFPLEYKGIFTYAENGMIEVQFHDAYKFVTETKGLELVDLKREFPNPDNLLDRLPNSLNTIEQELFVGYVKQKYKKPSSTQLEALLIGARLSQRAFKEISEYFNSEIDNISIEHNKSLQLTSLYTELFNYYTAQKEQGPINKKYEIFHKYLINFSDQKKSIDKECLDGIIAQIKYELMDDDFEFSIDEIVMSMTRSDTIRKNSIGRVHKSNIKNESFFNRRVAFNKAAYSLRVAKDLTEARKIIYSIKDEEILVNLEMSLSNINSTTARQAETLFETALEIYRHLLKTTDTLKYKKYALFSLLSLSTNLLNLRTVKKEEIKNYFHLLDQYKDSFNERDILILLIRKASFEICQKNFTKAIPMIEQFILKTACIKLEEYDTSLLCIWQTIANEIENKTLKTQLKKPISHLTHDCIKYQDISRFNFY